MKFHRFVFLLLLAVALIGCGAASTPFYSGPDAMLAEVKKLQEQFPGNAKYQLIVFFYEGLSGNIIGVNVKTQPESKMIEVWNYRNTPVKSNRRGTQVNWGSMGSWEKSAERFDEDNGMDFFDLNQIPWAEIPKWIAEAMADMKKRGVSEPEFDGLTLMNSVDGLVAMIDIETMGGGSSLTYMFNMDGRLVSEP